MSKLIYLCARNVSELPFRRADIDAVFSRLTPDNLSPRPPRIIESKGILIGIFNPADSLPIRDYSVCLGTLFAARMDWWQPGAEIPDGSYALFRGDAGMLDLVSDIVSSRTIWYAQTADLFIASTSQRAIVCFLQGYEPNEAAYPWMLSSGTLGPGQSWDRRIQCLGADSRLRLDRATWQIEVTRKPVEYKPLDLPRQEHERRLREAINETFEHLTDLRNWILPLSGGYDSRAILQMLKTRAGLKSVTWGLRSAMADKRSDAWVARELARRFGIAHEYLETDRSDETADKILERFLVAGEGRTDHVSGYMDGFAIWRRLYESGCQGILRGDEAFGCHAVYSDRQVYHNMHLNVLSDFGNMEVAALGLEASGQKRPESLEQRHDETREAWRDRVSAEFEIPILFAALSDLKLAFVEIIHPLLSRRIIETVRTLPDELRTEKLLFKSIVSRNGPNIPYATHPAIEARGNILRSAEMADAIISHLQASSSQSDHIAIMSRYALKLMEMDKVYKLHDDRSMPTRLFRWARRKAGLDKDRLLVMDPYQFGFRVYIISRMHEILTSDARQQVL